MNQKYHSFESLINSFVKFSAIILLTILTNNTKAQNLLSSPECASYDYPRNRYLVSCYQSGNIVQIDSNGVHSNLLTGFGNVLSNTLRGNIFYFSVINGIKGYDISVSPPLQVMNISIPTSIQLDGMVIDTSGNLYVTDFDYSGINDKIYKINLTTQTWSLFVPPGHGLGSPQDVEYDKENNRLIIANWFNGSPIQSVSLSDSTVTNIVASSIGNFDGIARDTSGNYYFTSWTTGKVHKYDKYFTNPPTIIASGFSGPSNLSYNPRGNLLVVPDFNANSIIFVQLNSIGIKKISGTVSENFRLSQNYPNPFNPVTTIKFEIPYSENDLVILKIYDVLGKEVFTLVNEKLNPGTYEVTFNGSNYPGGVYFYKLFNNDFVKIKKMVMIK